MSFTFSRALVEGYSRGTCSDGAASAPSSSTPTPDLSWWPDKTTEHSRLSRFGMTCAPLTGAPGEAVLTWWLEASLARTFLSPAAATASTASDPASGPKWRASFVKYDPAESRWKTPQCSLLGGLDEFSETWPKWGSMRNGECWERTTAALPTAESESGSWAWRMGLTKKPTHNVPTPTASDHIERKSTSKEVLNPDTNKTVSLDRWVKFWPTPTASLGEKGGLVTPQKGREGGTLTEAVAARMFPTPAARDFRHPNAKSYEERGGGKKGEQLPNAVGGPLNPPWVEWLMGWPIGWTDLRPLETAKFHEWRLQHGAFSAASEREAA